MIFRWMIKLIILLNSMFICGCSVKWSVPKSSWNVPTTAYVCIYANEQYHDKIAQAIWAWDRAIGSWRHLVPVFEQNDHCSYLIREVTEPHHILTNAVAWAAIGGREISLLKGRYEYAPDAIVLHEIGHLMGAQHITRTTMDPITYKPFLNEEICPDIYTMAQVAAFNKLKLETLSWCYF